ncbi:MAG: GtrA family protein [Candidatus Gastranaerophilales bacterium]|nr:GtrA family protein [Candidatus Gastranaerophilales bacterium]
MGKKRFEFIRYCAIGCSGALLDFLCYTLLVKIFSLHYLIANILSVSVGITNNFFLNAFLNFKVTNKLLKRYLTFFAVGIFGLAISELLLYVLVEKNLVNEIIAKIATIFVITFVQFFLNKFITFKQKKEE